MAFGGYYKRTRFRSLLELSVIRHLESEGLILGETMLYEDTIIPYGKDQKRRYIVDLTLLPVATLVEVKPSSRANNRNNRTKREAAEEWCRYHGWTYVIVTEEELKQCGQLLTLEEARHIPDIQWGKKALRAMRARDRKTKKK